MVTLKNVMIVYFVYKWIKSSHAHCAANPVSIIGLSLILMYVLWMTVQAIELVYKAACTLVVFGNNR